MRTWRPAHFARRLCRSDGRVYISRAAAGHVLVQAAPIVAELSLPASRRHRRNRRQVEERPSEIAAPRLVLLLSPRYTRAKGDVWAPLLASHRSTASRTRASFVCDPSISDPAPLSARIGYPRPATGTCRLPTTTPTGRPGRPYRAHRRRSPICGRRPADDRRPFDARLAHSPARSSGRLAGLITLGTPHLGAASLSSPPRYRRRRPLPGLLTRRWAACRAARRSRLSCRSRLCAGAGGDSAPRAPCPSPSSTAAARAFDRPPRFTRSLYGRRHAAYRPLRPLHEPRGGLAPSLGRPARPDCGLGAARLPLPLRDITAEARARFDLLEISFDGVGGAAVQPTHGVRFSARLFRRDGWLLGNPSTLPLDETFTDPRAAFDDVRLREIELGLDAKLEAGTARGRPWMRLRDAAVHGPTLALTETVDSFAAAAAGALFRSLTDATAPPSASASASSPRATQSAAHHYADGIPASTGCLERTGRDPIGFVAAPPGRTCEPPAAWLV